MTREAQLRLALKWVAEVQEHKHQALAMDRV
jgi:hypothetical protein